MDSSDEAVLSLLRSKLQRGVKERGRADFDRRIGRPRTGWTSKFLAGKEGVPSLPALLRILDALDVHPADFFAEAFPRQEVEMPPRGEFEEAVVRTLRRLGIVPGEGAEKTEKS